ncbi:MAG: hypothetical protein JWN91_3273 [Nocardioides sp.]|jgi:glycosyltransferase A (GT-A) superfamily protein (DUF2064 family)|nr:hypothetical protein [Nocardioides sp.]
MTGARVLVVAKAPVAGRVKTRLGAEIGMAAAAEIAAAALLDTMAACHAGFGPDACLLSLSGDFADSVRGDELARAAEGWSVARQRGSTFAERLANAHLDVPPGGPVVQVGMDTPQLTPALLTEVAAATDEHDAVLGPAEDGGWWVLALRRPTAARSLHDVPMSAPTTYDDTRRALVGEGLDVGAARTLRDVDTVADADAVAAAVPGSHFARAWGAR